MPATFEFEALFTTQSDARRARVAVRKVIVGGWTGRDRAALAHHVEELAKIGVTPPARMPMFYRVGVTRLSTADAIEVIGTGSSGEVEYVLLNYQGRLWVGVGSDHTDRTVEAQGITVAKQLCDKPIATGFWPLDEVEPHWNRLTLRSVISEGGADCPYQDGSVASLISPRELIAALEAEGGSLDDGTLMFGGTCGAIGGVRYAEHFTFELADPVLNRRLGHGYAVVPVPIVG